MRSVSSLRAEAVLARHHDVENGKVDRIGRQPGARALRIARLRHAKALLGQILRQRLADRALVVDEEEVGNLGHVRTLAGGGAP